MTGVEDLPSGVPDQRLTAFQLGNVCRVVIAEPVQPEHPLIEAEADRSTVVGNPASKRGLANTDQTAEQMYLRLIHGSKRVSISWCNRDANPIK